MSESRTVLGNILVVDDSAEDIRKLKEILGPAGYKIRPTKNVESGLNALRLAQADLVLLDVMLAGEESFEACERFHEVDAALPVLFMSVIDDGPAKAKAFAAGGADYLTKDFQPEEVVARVAMHITRRNLERSQREDTAELRRLRDLVESFFSKRLFERMERGGQETLMMQQRELTLCFWDIRGFSGLCDTLQTTPDLIVDFLREYCDLAARTIDMYGGVLDKFMGDGIMALFGVWEPKPLQKETALCAAQCAVDLQREFEKLHDRWLDEWHKKSAKDIPIIKLGCGMHYGPAFVGRVGTSYRDQFTAIGPNVNLCSRIESRAGKEGSPDLILVSKPFKKLLEDVVEFRESCQIDDFRNMQGKYTLYSLLRIKPGVEPCNP